MAADARRWRSCRRVEFLSNAAFFLALLWVVHPVHSAAVDYVSGRADSLAFFFASAGWLLYLRARDLRYVVDSPGLCLRSGDALRALFALCSRESGVLWMLLFLLYLFALRRRNRPCERSLLVAGGLPDCRWRSTPDCGSFPSTVPRTAPRLGWTSRTRGVLMLRALGDYGRLMVFPSESARRTQRFSTRR